MGRSRRTTGQPVGRDRSDGQAGSGATGACVVRRDDDHRLPGVLAGDRRRGRGRRDLRAALPGRPHDVDQTVVPLDDVPVRVGVQGRSGTRAGRSDRSRGVRAGAQRELPEPLRPGRLRRSRRLAATEGDQPRARPMGSGTVGRPRSPALAGDPDRSLRVGECPLHRQMDHRDPRHHRDRPPHSPAVGRRRPGRGAEPAPRGGAVPVVSGDRASHRRHARQLTRCAASAASAPAARTNHSSAPSGAGQPATSTQRRTSCGPLTSPSHQYQVRSSGSSQKSQLPRLHRSSRVARARAAASRPRHQASHSAASSGDFSGTHDRTNHAGSRAVIAASSSRSAGSAVSTARSTSRHRCSTSAGSPDVVARTSARPAPPGRSPGRGPSPRAATPRAGSPAAARDDRPLQAGELVGPQPVRARCLRRVDGDDRRSGLPGHALRYRSRRHVVGVRSGHVEGLDHRVGVALADPLCEELVGPALVAEVQEQHVVTLDGDVPRGADVQARVRRALDAEHPDGVRILDGGLRGQLLRC